jgi:hypothetical protein
MKVLAELGEQIEKVLVKQKETLVPLPVLNRTFQLGMVSHHTVPQLTQLAVFFGS